jgi:integrase
LRKSNFIRRSFKPLLRRAGLPDVDFHSLRHSSNSFLIEEGADPILVARRNGHVDTRMVLDHYGHMFEGARRQAAETMDRVFRPSRLVVKRSSKRSRWFQKIKRGSQKSL